MGAHDSLKSLVRQYIKTNGQNEITGQILQNVLIAMIDDLGITIDSTPTNDSPNAVASGGVYNALKAITDFLNNGYYFVGIAGTSMVPDSVTQHGIFYIASDGGTYTNFLNGDNEPLTLYQGLNILYKNVEDDGWNNFEVFKFSDFVDTTRQQSLSSQQKAQARTNIAAVSYEQQSLNAGQQVQAQNNMMGKAYSSVAADHSGLGKVYLQKNNGVLTQSMMQATNTVYVIQYDYTMSGNITVPAGCILQFDGGSISGGNGVSLTYNKTNIVGDYEGRIRCLCTGSVFNQMATPEMYGATGDYETDDYNALQACIDNNSNIYLPKQYSISKTLWVKNIGTHITGKGKRITSIKKTTKTPTENVDAIFLVKGSPSRIYNIEISGISFSTAANIDYCIKIENITTYTSLNNLRIEGFDTGISITDGWVYSLSNVDVYSAGSGKGIIVTNVNVIDIFHSFGSTCGVFLDNVTGTLVGCDFENSNACYDISNGSTITLMHCRTETYYVSIRSNSSEVTCIGGIYEIHYSNAVPLGFIEAIDSSLKIYGTKFYFDNYGGYPASASGAVMFKLQGSTMYYDREIDSVRDADWQNMTLLSVDATSVLNSVGNVKTKNVSRYGVTGDIDYSGRNNREDDYIIVAQFPLGYRRSVECKCKGLGMYFDDIINIDAVITAFYYNEQPNITVNDQSTVILNTSQEGTFSVTAEYANGILTVKFNMTPGQYRQFDYRAKVNYTYQYFDQNINNPYLE